MARGTDHEAVLAAVREDAGWCNRYAFMTLMSAGIALLGLLLSSPAVVIGAMLVSPLMGPIIGLGFAFATFDWPRVRQSLWTLAAGSALAVGFCALIVLVSPLQGATSEIMARTRPNLFDLLVAVFSALAGAYATIRSKGATIVGVAIATALMPPLAVVGFGLATGQRAIWAGAFTLFITNFVAIAASAAVMARLYGFGSRLSPSHTRFQAWLLFGLMALLAVPLGWSLRDIATESAAGREVRRAVDEVLGEEARVTELDVRREDGALRVDAVAVTPGFVADARRRVEAEVERRVGRDVDLRLVQIRAEDGERIAAVEASRAGEARRAAADAAAGVAPEAVALDGATRMARATADPMLGQVARLRTLEARLAADFPDWTVRLAPNAATPLAALKFAPGSAEAGPAGETWANDVAWALARWDAPGVVIVGRAAPDERPAPDAEAVAGGMSGLMRGPAPLRQAEALAIMRANAASRLLRARGVAALTRGEVASAALVDEFGAAAARSAQASIASPAEAEAAKALVGMADDMSQSGAPGGDREPIAGP
jgi:uncharacterized hydrophobic protein (TIGR00271 family)